MHGSPMTYSQWMQQMRHNEQTGRGVVFAIDYHEHIVGQISLGAIDLGSMRTGVIGYWVDQRYAGHGFAPMAVALLADWAFCDPTGPRLHRMEIALLPENERSRRVAVKWGVIMRACGPGTCSSTGSGAIMRPTACSPRTPATGSSIV